MAWRNKMIVSVDGWHPIFNQFQETTYVREPVKPMKKRTRILNRKLKKFGTLKSYSEYVKIKTNVLRNVSDDEDLPRKLPASKLSVGRDSSVNENSLTSSSAGKHFAADEDSTMDENYTMNSSIDENSRIDGDSSVNENSMMNSTVYENSLVDEDPLGDTNCSMNSTMGKYSPVDEDSSANKNFPMNSTVNECSPVDKDPLVDEDSLTNFTAEGNTPVDKDPLGNENFTAEENSPVDKDPLRNENCSMISSIDENSPEYEDHSVDKNPAVDENSQVDDNFLIDESSLADESSQLEPHISESGIIEDAESNEELDIQDTASNESLNKTKSQPVVKCTQIIKSKYKILHKESSEEPGSWSVCAHPDSNETNDSPVTPQVQYTVSSIKDQIRRQKNSRSADEESPRKVLKDCTRSNMIYPQSSTPFNNQTRPLKLSQFVSAEELLAMSEPSTITTKDIATTIEQEDDIWLLEIPKSIIKDPGLCGKTMLLGEDTLKIGEVAYDTRRINNESVSCILQRETKKSRYKIVNVGPVGSIHVRRRSQESRKSSWKLSSPGSPTPPKFPKNITLRNPLLSKKSRGE